MRKSIYIPFAKAMPNIATIDKDPCVYIQSGGKKCGACVKFCEANAIDFNQADQVIELKVGTIILATGYSLLDPSKIPQYGYGKYDNVITGLEFERITCVLMATATGAATVINAMRLGERVALIGMSFADLMGKLNEHKALLLQ